MEYIFLIKLFIVFIAGGIVGLERQMSGSQVGIRTCMLICLATMVFIHLGQSVMGRYDPTRVLGQVVTGVGFLGAGVIISRGGRIIGVTTAAVVWVLAAIGCAIGFRHYAAAIMIAVVTVAILSGLQWLENRIDFLQQRCFDQPRRDADQDRP